jgi:hypothetical protein
MRERKLAAPLSRVVEFSYQFETSLGAPSFIKGPLKNNFPATDVAQTLSRVPNATYFSQNLESGKNCGAGWQPAAGW